MGMSPSGVITYADNYLIPNATRNDGSGSFQPSFANRENFVRNSLFNYNDAYAVGYTFNGTCDPNATAPFLTSQFGVQMKQPYWRHYSPLFVAPDNDEFYTQIGGFFNNKNVPHSKIEADPGETHIRSWKSFGAGTLFGLGTQGTFNLSNDNADRGSGLTGGKYLYPSSSMPIISNTSLSTVDTNTSMNNGQIWIRDEWFQITDVPDSAVTAKVGMKCRIHEDDKLRPLNWCGFYVWSENSTATTRIVDYCRIRNTSGSYTLPTGSLTGTAARYNWNGSSHTNTDGNSCSNFSATDLARTTAGAVATDGVTATERLTLDQDDLETWTDVEFTITLQTGTSRTLGFAYFFAENASYMHSPPANSPNSGGFDVFDPYVTFHT